VTRKNQPTEESFLKDVAKHEVKVLMENGVYRHIRCSSGSFNQQFDIVTWPGYLAYSGDMGCFVFSRLNDMLSFFRNDWINDPKDGILRINEPYWSEKLEAVDRDGYHPNHKEFSKDKFRENVEYYAKLWIEEFDVDAKEKKAFESGILEEIEDQIYRYIDDGEHELRRAVNEFEYVAYGYKYHFHDTWEWDCTEYTFRFTWCCYAIAWTIKQYDAMKAAAVPMGEQAALDEARKRWGQRASIYDRSVVQDSTRTDKWVGCIAFVDYKGDHIYGNGDTWEDAFRDAEKRQERMVR
jgi:hypothetical protein